VGTRAVVLLHLCARLGLAGLFLYAGGLKLADPAGFAQDLLHYRVLSEPLAGPLAVGFPVLEIVCGLALLTRTYTRGAAFLIAAMLALFALAMAQAKLRGINLDCGCFGAAADVQVSWTKVAINVGLAMLAIWVARSTHVGLALRTGLAASETEASRPGSGSG
jgi:putative oxidoreductase